MSLLGDTRPLPIRRKVVSKISQETGLSGVYVTISDAEATFTVCTDKEGWIDSYVSSYPVTLEIDLTGYSFYEEKSSDSIAVIELTPAD